MKSLPQIMQPYYPKIILKNPELLRKKTILVTGASGLIGSNIISYLDWLNAQKKLNLKIIGIIRSRLEPWMPQSKAIGYHTYDLSTQELPADTQFDYLIHAATYAQPKKFLEHPEETMRLNITTLFQLLRLTEKNTATFVYISSAEVYGEADKEHIPTDESYAGNVNTLSDRAVYAESKRMAETICYIHRQRVPIKIIRSLITFGPGVRYDDRRVISEFTKRAQNEGAITMMDAGAAQRTFCFITDWVEMVLNIMLSGREMVYNVCGVETITIRQLAQMLSKINGAKFRGIADEQKIQGTPQVTVLSNKRYMDEFHKKNFVPMKEGLNITSEWFKNIL